MNGTKSKLGRPRIPLKWTRVFKIEPQVVLDIDIFEIELDHNIFDDHYKEEDPSLNSEWRLLFDPNAFKDQAD